MYRGLYQDATRETLWAYQGRSRTERVLYDWGNREIQTQVINEFWAREARLKASHKRSDPPEEGQTPPPKKARTKGDLAGNPAVRLVSPLLHQSTVIHIEDEPPRSVRLGPLIGSVHKEVMKLSDPTDTVHPDPFLTVNSTRAQWLARYCAPSPRWRQWQTEAAELDEADAVLSHQFLECLRRLHKFDAVIGMHPLQAPGSYASAWWHPSRREGWATDVQPEAPLVVFHPFCLQQGHENLHWLASSGSLQWRLLAPAKLKDTVTLRWLTAHATLVHQFPKGSRLLSCKNAWRQASFRTRRTAKAWNLWGPKRLAQILAGAQEEGVPAQLQNLALTEGGTLPIESLSMEDFLFGQRAELLQRHPEALVAATDGSVLQDGRMGAAVTFLRGELPEAQQGVNGDPCSMTAEMTAIILALRQGPPAQPLIILTDSQTTLVELSHCQRRVFRRLVTPRDSQSLLCTLVAALNEWAALQPVFLVKVRAHSGFCLNERADELANQAALLEPPPPQCGPSMSCRFRDATNPGPWAHWNPRIAKLATQNYAHAQFESASILWPPRQLAPPPQPTVESWLATPNAGRFLLGQTIQSMHCGPPLKRLMQAIGHTYPTASTLHLWNIKDSPGCPLGTCTGVETLARLQCGCQCTKNARIAAHHAIWGELARGIQASLPCAETTMCLEVTPTGLSRLMEVQEGPYMAAQLEWQQATADLSENDLTPLPAPPDTLARPSPSAPAEQTARPTRSKRARLNSTAQVALPEPQARHLHAGPTAPPESDMQSLLANPRDNGSTFTVHEGQEVASDTLSPSTQAAGSRRLGGRKRKRFVPRVKPAPTRPSSYPELDQALAEHQRPDGLLINWRSKRFYILEFTRAYDPDMAALEQADARKVRRYAQLCDRIQRKLHGWNGEVVPFTIGIRGTINYLSWKRRLKALGVPEHKEQAIVLATLKATLDGLDTLFLARNSQLRPERPVPQHGQLRPGNPDNPDNPRQRSSE